MSLEALGPRATRNSKSSDTLGSAWLLVLIADHLQLVSKFDRLLNGGSAKSGEIYKRSPTRSCSFIKNAYFVELPHEEPQRADVRQGHRFCLPLPVCGIHFERGGELELRYLNGEIHWILEHRIDHSQAFSSWPARSDSSSLRASRSEASECRKQSCNVNCRRIRPSEISRGKPSNNLILKFPIYPFQQFCLG